MTSGKRFIADFEPLEHRLRLFLERDLNEHADRGADLQGIEQRDALQDHARFLELAHSRQARRRRQADLRRKGDIRQARILLQGRENAPIDGVKPRIQRFMP